MLLGCIEDVRHSICTSACSALSLTSKERLRNIKRCSALPLEWDGAWARLSEVTEMNQQEWVRHRPHWYAQMAFEMLFMSSTETGGSLSHALKLICFASGKATRICFSSLFLWIFQLAQGNRFATFCVFFNALVLFAERELTGLHAGRQALDGTLELWAGKMNQ